MKQGMELYSNIFKSKKICGACSLGAADPFIYKWNGYYYLTCTRENGLVLMKSFDLLHWKYVNENHGIVAEDEYLRYAFAPEISYDNGYFYFISSPSGNGHRIYRAKDLLGPYEPMFGNIEELIDGSFFKDSDEKRYFLRATESGITIKKWKDQPVKSDFSLFDSYFTFLESNIGNWTEGPYLLKRYGYYYLTYTGTHFLSTAYRVDYASGKKLSEDGLHFQKTLLLSTRDDFFGLGHSMTFLGPDLDSYYIAYHNREASGNRYLNISRLMFDRHGHMTCNGVGVKRNILWKRPTFETFVEGKDYLTSQEFENRRFSLEFNFIGKDVLLYLAYKDENTYQRISLEDHEIAIFEKTGGEENKIFSHPLNREYKKDVFHCLRLQYGNGKITIYLDDMELVYQAKVPLQKGKIGFKNNELQPSYLAYSLVAYGDSDIQEIKKENFFLDNCKQAQKGYHTSILIDEKGEYDFYLVTEEKAELSLSIDHKVLLTALAKDKGENYFGSISLTKGIHELEIQGLASSKNKVIHWMKKEVPSSYVQETFLKDATVYHRYLALEDGIYLENDRNALLTPLSYRYYDVKVDMKMVGNPTWEDRFIGLIADLEEYGKTNEFENGYSLIGYLLVANRKYISVIEANFMHSKVLKKIRMPKKDDLHFEIKKDAKGIYFYVDGKEIYSIQGKNLHARGKIGVYNHHASAIFRNLTIENLEEKSNEKK